MIFLLLLTFFAIYTSDSVENFFKQSHRNHTNNWAIIVGTSRFWFNYRHTSNPLGFYRTVKRLGIPDSHIILMLADDHACNARNVFPGEIFHNANRQSNVYGDAIEVDYRGYDVTVELFIRLMTGRHDPSVPRTQRLLSDERSNILLYMSGHGGDEFLKFQDSEELSAMDLADCVEQMYQKKRYNEMMIVIDTCQAESMFFQLYSPNIFAIGSSKRRTNSYSHHHDKVIGVSVVDRFSYYSLEYLDQLTLTSTQTIANFFSYFRPELLHSQANWRTDLYKKDISKVLVTDFFASVTPNEITSDEYLFSVERTCRYTPLEL